MPEAFIMIDGGVPKLGVNQLRRKLGGHRPLIRLENPLKVYAEAIDLLERWAYIPRKESDLRQDLREVLAREIPLAVLPKVKDFGYSPNNVNVGSIEPDSIDVKLLVNKLMASQFHHDHALHVWSMVDQHWS